MKLFFFFTTNILKSEIYAFLKVQMCKYYGLFLGGKVLCAAAKQLNPALDHIKNKKMSLLHLQLTKNWTQYKTAWNINTYYGWKEIYKIELILISKNFSEENELR